MAKIKCKCGETVVESKKDIVIKLAGTDSETSELEKLIGWCEKFELNLIDFDVSSSAKAIKLLAEEVLSIRRNYEGDVDNQIDWAVRIGELEDKVNFLETSRIQQINDNPQSKNPLTIKEITGLLHHEWDCKCKDCFSGRKKLESYLGI